METGKGPPGGTSFALHAHRLGTCMRQAGQGDREWYNLLGSEETVLFLRGQMLGTHQCHHTGMCAPYYDFFFKRSQKFGFLRESP